MSKSEVKIAAVGTGGIWNTHYRNLIVLGDCKVIAVCEIDEANREKGMKQTGGRGYSNIDEMLEKEPDVQGIVACTPPTVRLQVVQAASKRKIPVFMEKPPASSLADAAAIVKLVRETGTPVFIGFMYRYLAAVERMKQFIGDEPINLVQSSFYCPGATRWNLPGWFYIKERSGGHVLDQAVHVMDLIRYIAGDITQVFTLGNNVIRPKTEDFTIEDSSSTAMRFASGASGTHIHSWTHSEFTGFLTAVGKEFRLTLQYDLTLTGFVGDQKIDETMPTPPDNVSHHIGEMEAFLDSIRTGDFSGMRSPFEDAAKSLATVLAMNESIDTGLPVKVKLDF